MTFFICIIFFGIFYGSISLYLLWYVIKFNRTPTAIALKTLRVRRHLEELVTKYHPEKYSSIKSIQGTLIAIKCFGGETPFFFLSGECAEKMHVYRIIILAKELTYIFFTGIIIKKLGHQNSMIIGLATLSIRLCLYYVITNPLWILPVEILSGLGYALPYSAMTSYAAVIAPENLKGTIQGLVGAVFQGIGMYCAKACTDFSLGVGIYRVILYSFSQRYQDFSINGSYVLQ